MSTLEFASEADLVRHYSAIRKRMRALRAPPIPPPIIAPPIPPPAPKTRDEQLAEILAGAPSPFLNVIAGKTRRIQMLVAQMHKITFADLIASRRTKHIVRARHIAIYIVRHETTHSLLEIGRRFGGMDHSSIIFAERKIARLMAEDAALAAEIAAIREAVA